MKALAKIFYLILKFLNFLSNKFFKRDFALYLKLLIEKNSYFKKKILDQTITLFAPNELIKWRIDTLLTKEPETIEWINNFKDNKELVFWDIGANIGLYSIYAALRYKDIKIISFEPSTNNLRILSRNISINQLDEKIFINQLPLSDKEVGFNKLYESEFQEGFSQNAFGEKINYEGKNLNSKNHYKILGASIDYFLKNKLISFPNYIKIDVDGIEHLILRGGQKALKDDKLNSILVEINENYKDQYNEILKIMGESNFKLKSKLREDRFYKGKFNKTFNYIFER